MYCFSVGIRDLPIDVKWFPAGPSFSFFPYPVSDPCRPWKGTQCKACAPTCYGHYVTNLDQLLELYSKGKAIRSPPPSDIISTYIKCQDNTEAVLNIDRVALDKLSKKCLLPPDEVKIWLSHLHQVTENRKRGVEKAKVTREKNKTNKSKS
jgi:hypothetical protein